MSSLFGMKIIESNQMPATRPRMKLSPTLLVSDEFRIEFDRWLEDFFGREMYILVFQGNALITNPENVVKILIDRAWIGENENARP